MIQCLLTGDNGAIETIAEPRSGCWVNVVAPTAEERAWLEGELGVLPEFVSSALDDEETSRVDYDEDARQIFVIVDYPVVGEDGAGVRPQSPLQYDTMPLSMVFLPERGLFVTISILENEVVDDLACGRIRNVDTRLRTRFLLQMLLQRPCATRSSSRCSTWRSRSCTSPPRSSRTR